MNQLSSSTSLYLRQHSNNPVEWHPWGDAALEMARKLDRPILLSIGYSACHWCHVMAHESFEDPSTARWMNELFINIKVDREERPDLDRVYQLSHQFLTGRGGGWPLTVFLDPGDLVPFFAGTYFPPVARHGMPPFTEILKKVRQWFDDHRDQVGEQNRQLSDAIAALQAGDAQELPLVESVFESALEHMKRNYDPDSGGFGGAPKFPQAPLLALLRAVSLKHGQDYEAAGEMLRETLRRMALSGLRDHLDGGFFRYTVDGQWTIPHFEKMLYDNAMLLPLYAEGAQRWGDALLQATAEGIVDWLSSEMRHENGAFFASIDADADGVEGGYHVWQREQVRELLNGDEYAAVAETYGLDSTPNFEGHSWHLLRRDDGVGKGMPPRALRKLRAARSERTPPGTDTKQLTAWNALCAEGLARAGIALGRPDWLDLAEQTVDFLHANLWRNGKLYAVHAQGQAQFTAYLDDHAYLLNALLVLLQERWKPRHMEFALDLSGALLAEFGDAERGGFYFTSEQEAVPIHRLRPTQDDATPAGNGIAARALLTLGHLTGERRYLEEAERTLAAAADGMVKHPLAHATLVAALNDFLDPVTQVIVTGHDHGEREALKAAARKSAGGLHRLNCYAFGPASGELPGILGGHDHGRAAAAFVCKGMKCMPPVSTATELTELLAKRD